MGEYTKNTQDISDLQYSRETLRYAEHICRNYEYYKDSYEQLAGDAIYSFFSRECNVKINTYTKSDVTAQAALILASQGNRQIAKLEIILDAVSRLMGVLDGPHKVFFNEHLLCNKEKPKFNLEQKRMRKRIMTLLCFYLGEPQYHGRKRSSTQDSKG